MKFNELEKKDVVDVRNGRKMGIVSDLDIDENSLCIKALIVCEVRWKDFVLIFSKPRIKRIPIENIVKIGRDVILVKC